MKISIGSLSLLLLLGSISPSFAGSCDTKKQELDTFLRNVQKVHIAAHADEKTALEICGRVNEEFEKLSSEQRPREAECQMSKFLEAFFTAHVQVLKLVTSLIYESYVFQDLSDDFLCKSQVVCNKKALDSPECRLKKFLDKLKSIGVSVKKDLLAFLAICEKMNALSRSFQCAHSLSCSEVNSAGGKLFSRIQVFIKDFKPLLCDSGALITNIFQVCEGTGEEITQWIQRKE